MFIPRTAAGERGYSGGRGGISLDTRIHKGPMRMGRAGAEVILPPPLASLTELPSAEMWVVAGDCLLLWRNASVLWNYFSDLAWIWGFFCLRGKFPFVLDS